MDLILWRHADAAPGARDLERKLTAKGRKQAERVAAWLTAKLPGRYTMLASPARRARETADALGTHKGAVVVVGHQPDLGQVAALLVSGTEADWSVKKGGLWWLSNREREGESQVVVRAVLAPDLI
jgi:phosphohistidine phosphatase